MAWVWEHSRSRGNERLVLLAIADCANDQGESAYPSLVTLTRKAAVSRSTVLRSIEALVALGELRVDTAASKYGTNEYAVIMDHGGVNMTPGGCQDDTGGGVTVTPEPSVEPSVEPDPSLRSGTAVAVTSEPVNAGQIIKAYCDRLPARPPGRVLAQLGRYVKELLDEGKPPRVIWAGLVVWHERKAQPATLASFVADQMNRGAFAESRAPSTTERRAAEAVAAGQRVEARMRAEGRLV